MLTQKLLGKINLRTTLNFSLRLGIKEDKSLITMLSATAPSVEPNGTVQTRSILDWIATEIDAHLSEPSLPKFECFLWDSDLLCRVTQSRECKHLGAMLLFLTQLKTTPVSRDEVIVDNCIRVLYAMFEPIPMAFRRHLMRRESFGDNAIVLNSLVRFFNCHAGFVGHFASALGSNKCIPSTADRSNYFGGDVQVAHVYGRFSVKCDKPFMAPLAIVMDTSYKCVGLVFNWPSSFSVPLGWSWMNVEFVLASLRKTIDALIGKSGRATRKGIVRCTAESSAPVDSIVTPLTTSTKPTLQSNLPLPRATRRLADCLHEVLVDRASIDPKDSFICAIEKLPLEIISRDDYPTLHDWVLSLSAETSGLQAHNVTKVFTAMLAHLGSAEIICHLFSLRHFITNAPLLNAWLRYYELCEFTMTCYILEEKEGNVDIHFATLCKSLGDSSIHLVGRGDEDVENPHELQQQFSQYRLLSVRSVLGSIGDRKGFANVPFEIVVHSFDQKYDLKGLIKSETPLSHRMSLVAYRVETVVNAMEQAGKKNAAIKSELASKVDPALLASVAVTTPLVIPPTNPLVSSSNTLKKPLEVAVEEIATKLFNADVSRFGENQTAAKHLYDIAGHMAMFAIEVVKKRKAMEAERSSTH
jgi:hypothetical protein